MKKTLKKFANLNRVNSVDELNTVILIVEGSCSDGQKRSASHYIKEDEIEELMIDVSYNSLGNWKSTDIPDNEIFTALWIKELYFIDKNGIRFNIEEKC